MRIMRPILLGSLLMGIIASPVLSQSDGGVTEQVWADFNPAYFFNPHTKIYGDVGVRGEVDTKDWWRLVVRPSVSTRISGRFYFTAGLGNFYTFNEIIADRYELRPFQGLKFKWPMWRTPLSHYIRLEERFDFNTATWNSKVSARLRYKLSISYRWGAVRPGRFWQVTGGVEGFLTLAGQQGQFQEQTRVTVGLDRSLARNNHLRFEVTWQKEAMFFIEGGSVSNIYFRFRYTRSWGRQKE